MAAALLEDTILLQLLQSSFLGKNILRVYSLYLMFIR